MRVRNRLAAPAVAATLLVAPAADAGTGSSATCTGGTVLLSNPVTVGVKVESGAGGANTKIWICYSTTPTGTPGAGGALLVDVWRCATPSATCHPGIYVAAACFPDGAGVPCHLPTYVNVSPDDVSAGVPQGSCAAYAGSACVVHLPQGVWLRLDGNPSRPLVSAGVLGTKLIAESPVPCVSTVAPCG